MQSNRSTKTSSDASAEFPSPLPKCTKEKHVSMCSMFCFGALILLCFFIFIPIHKTTQVADGNCILYAGTHGYGPATICSYCIACSVVLLILCAIRVCLLVYKMWIKRKIGIIDTAASHCSVIGVHTLILYVDICLVLMLLVTACLLSTGLASLCDNMFGSKSGCASAPGILLPNGEVNDSFYTNLAFAEGSAWFAFVFWCLVVVFEAFMARKVGTLQDPIEAVKSMSKTGNPV